MFETHRFSKYTIASALPSDAKEGLPRSGFWIGYISFNLSVT